MGQAQHKFEVIQGGCFDLEKADAKQPTKQPPNNLEKWLVTADLISLSGVSQAAVHKALAKRQWRGAELVVREEFTGRGRGGKTLQVHVDSLPADLREAWYLERGVTLHQKADPKTGEVVMVPEQSFVRDERYEARLATARWRHDVIRPALATAKGSAERRTTLDALAAQPRLHPNGRIKHDTRRTLENWVVAYEADNAGLIGLMPAARADKGQRKTIVTRVWDDFFAGHINGDDQARMGDELTHYIRSLWGSGERGKRAIAEKATTWLIEQSRGLRVVPFEMLDLGRPEPKAGNGTQFEVCHVNLRRAYVEREYGVLAIKRKDNAVFQDNYMPHIMRDYSGYKPRDIVVGDVHPVDVMMKRSDGTVVYPKAISWIDIATNEIHMTFVLLEPGEGIKREHVAMAFEAMVNDWGLPKILYLDNGAEYSWDAMIEGFTQLSKLTTSAENDGFAVHYLGDSTEVRDRVLGSREAIVRSLAYNAKGKPKIEGAFGNIEKVQFALIPGWTAGDRMSKKTHAKGKDPIAFDGTGEDFLNAASIQLEWYHKRVQRGRLGGRSPNEALRDFINDGWGKTVLGNSDVLKLAFAEEHQRVPQSGRISFKTRHGDTQWFFADELLNRHEAITIRVPAWKPEFIFCFDGAQFLCVAKPERMYGALDPAGAHEGGRRRKYFAREVSKLAKHSALLDLMAETERHNQHMADTPDAPVAVTVHTDMLDRMKIAEQTARDEIAGRATDKPKAPEQFPTGPNVALDNLTYAED